MLDRLPLHVGPVIENKHSTGTDPADMPRNSAANCCNNGQCFPLSFQNKSGFAENFLIKCDSQTC